MLISSDCASGAVPKSAEHLAILVRSMLANQDGFGAAANIGETRVGADAYARNLLAPQERSVLDPRSH